MITLALSASVALAEDLHVPAQFATIQQAIDAAADGDTIRIAPGTYRESVIWVDKDLNIFGSGALQTIVDPGLGAGGPGGRAFELVNVPMSSRLDGIMIRGGNIMMPGGGMALSNSSPTISNCIFTANDASFGGAMSNVGSAPLIVNCLFHDNSAIEGGAIDNASSQPVIINSTFAHNTAIADGGAIFNVMSQPVIVNSILWGNAAGQIGSFGSTIMISDSIVEGGFMGINIMDADPLFVDSTAGDYRLDEGSPAIDAGDAEALVGEFLVDLAGEERVAGEQVDLGAYEFHPPSAIEIDVCALIAMLKADVHAATNGRKKWFGNGRAMLRTLDLACKMHRRGNDRAARSLMVVFIIQSKLMMLTRQISIGQGSAMVLSSRYIIEQLK